MTARYSQRDESQADSEAVVNSVSAGFDPEGLRAFLQSMLDQQEERPTAVEAFFSTRPTNQARISALDRQIAAIGPLSGRRLLRDTPEFHVMQTRVRAQPPPLPTTQ